MSAHFFKAVVLCDEHGVVTHSSVPTALLCDTNPNGRAFDSVFCLQSPEGRPISFRDVCSETEPSACVITMKQAGEASQLLLTATPLVGGGNLNPRWLLTTHESSRIAPEQLSSQHFKTLFQFAPDGIYLCDLLGTFIDGNAVAEEIVGYKKEELIGKNFFFLNLLSPDQIARGASGLIKNIQGKPTGPDEFSIRRKDGTKAVVEIRTFPMTLDGSKIVLGIVRDITSRKMMETQFLRNQRVEVIGALASGIAHDLNNVLAPIPMSLAMLRDTCTDPESLSLLSVIEASTQRGADVIQQLLTFGRGATQHTVLKPQHLLKQVLAIMRQTFPKSIQLKLTCKKTDWAVSGDPTQLYQVLLNLCVNARDAMPSGGHLTLSLDVAQLQQNSKLALKPGPYLLMSVRDTGKGIPSEIRDKIFEPFFTTKDPGKGTGLGLVTCASIVKQHGGFIEVQSQLGRGAEFKVYLPAVVAQPVADPAVVEKRSTGGSGQVILVVEDEEPIRKIVRRLLESNGYVVITAKNGKEGLSELTNDPKRISAVVIDLIMPTMDAQTAARNWRKFAPSTPVIAISGMLTKDIELHLENLKPQAFLPKPFSATQLLTTLQSVLATQDNQPDATCSGAACPFGLGTQLP